MQTSQHHHYVWQPCQSESLRYFCTTGGVGARISTQRYSPDFIAGLTLAVIALPQAIAYALIAELPPEMGLYTAIVAAIAGALWDHRAFCTGGRPIRRHCYSSALLVVAEPDTPEYILYHH